MEKTTKEFIALRQQIIYFNKFHNPTRIRLRKKLNKNLDDLISGISDIENAVSELPYKEYKKHKLTEVDIATDEQKKY